MNCREMVEHYLRHNGYDGLCNGDCGCELADLEPCRAMNSQCCAAYKGPPTEEGAWAMYPSREARDRAAARIWLAEQIKRMNDTADAEGLTGVDVKDRKRLIAALRAIGESMLDE